MFVWQNDSSINIFFSTKKHYRIVSLRHLFSIHTIFHGKSNNSCQCELICRWHQVGFRSLLFYLLLLFGWQVDIITPPPLYIALPRSHKPSSKEHKTNLFFATTVFPLCSRCIIIMGCWKYDHSNVYPDCVWAAAHQMYLIGFSLLLKTLLSLSCINRETAEETKMLLLLLLRREENYEPFYTYHFACLLENCRHNHVTRFSRWRKLFSDTIQPTYLILLAKKLLKVLLSLSVFK